MFRELFHDNPANALAIGGLLFFLVAFATMLIWISSRRRSAHYRHMASLPMEEGRVDGGAS